MTKETQWLQVGTLEQIPRLGARIIKREGGDIAVFRTANDAVFALLNRCPHKGGHLSEGIIHGQKVTCPMHNWVLDLANGEVQGPDEGCVQTFAVQVENGVVSVAMERNHPVGS